MNKYVPALATVIHLLPHPFGVSTIGALAVYGGARSNRVMACITPLVPLLIGNLIFGFYEPGILLFVYVGFGASALAARFVLREKQNGRRYTLAVGTGAVVFFLVSNFSVWLAGMYPPTAAGLATCYLNGLPYLGVAVLADGFYSLLLFNLHNVIERRPLTPVTA
jgi:hypothetical protein